MIAWARGAIAEAYPAGPPPKLTYENPNDRAAASKLVDSHPLEWLRVKIPEVVRRKAERSPGEVIGSMAYFVEPVRQLARAERENELDRRLGDREVAARARPRSGPSPGVPERVGAVVGDLFDAPATTKREEPPPAADWMQRVSAWLGQRTEAEKAALEQAALRLMYDDGVIKNATDDPDPHLVRSYVRRAAIEEMKRRGLWKEDAA